MRRIYTVPSVLIAFTLAAVTLCAQQASLKDAMDAAGSAMRHAFVAPAARVETPAQLPVTRVSLYKNGVGFFEHSGRVSGDQSVNIDFTTSQLDDVLQSLTAIDLNGGRIAGADYNSTQPLEQQLKALPLALGQSPDAMSFYNAIRGARVEVRTGGETVTGRLLNIEEVTTPASNNQAGGVRRQMTVVGDGGDVRTVELTTATEVHLLDADLHQDVTRYLQLLANTRNQGLRHLTLEDNGEGQRELRVSYISEVPIWKSTYRILFTEPAASAETKDAAQTATLQGWSVVDNTTGADWINVRLSLIAGAPQSFLQPLSQPIYSRRPQIGIAQQAQMAPQVHPSGEVFSGTSMAGAGIQGTVIDSNGAVIANAKVTATNTDTGVQTARTTNASGTYNFASLAPGNYNVEVVARGFQRLLQENVRLGANQRAALNPRMTVGGANQSVTVTAAPPMLNSQDATLGGSTGNEMYGQLPLSMNGGSGGGRGASGFQYLMPAAASAAANNGNAGIYGGTGQTNLNGNYMEGIPASAINYEQAAHDSLGNGATTAAFDDYFAYNITEPITIHKNESALVPTLQTKINAERVTLWSRQDPVPLRALWVTNTSKMTLDRGSFSIVEDGNFGGEGLLEPIHPGERRLLSYAVDQAVRVTTDLQSTSGKVVSITAAKGVVELHSTEMAEITYVVRNAADEARTVVVEHPIRTGYTLSPETKPAETTPSVYRFSVAAKPNETVRLHVVETEPGTTSYQLTNSDDTTLTYILEQTGHNAAVEAALKPIFAARRHEADMQEALNKANSDLTDLQTEEQRERDNVAAVAKVDTASRERFVRELNSTEDRVLDAQKVLATAMTAMRDAQQDLADKIESLQIEETI